MSENNYMPAYQVHRLKDAQRQQFRWAPHTSGTSIVKPKDYDRAEIIQAPTAYAAWEMLKGTSTALQVGDILEAEDGRLSICKYIGFEEANWFVPEQAPAAAAPLA